jgi:hypothetical protein
LRGVRQDQWKLYFPHTSQTYEGLEPGKDGFPGRTALRKIGLELYDLSSDVGERTNVAPQHPDIVARLQQLGEQARRDLGDLLSGVTGSGVRSPGRRGDVRQATPHLAIGASLTFAHPFDKRYHGGRHDALVDGKRGSLDYHDGLWQGFEGRDLDVLIDLGKEQHIRRVTSSFLENQYSWIFLPQEVTVALSRDGKQFRTASSTKLDASQPHPSIAVKEITATFPPEVTRYVRIVGRNISKCPSWHPGAGGEAWLFADEIEVL